MLLEKGAMVSAKNNVGDGPMHCAALQGHMPIICLLDASGASPCELGRVDNHLCEY